MARSPLKDVDVGERAQLLRVAVWFGPACLFILSALWGFLAHQGVIHGWVVVALLLLGLPLTALGVLAIYHATSRASAGLVRALYAAGDIPPPRTYPNQEVLIARGRYQEAAEWFRDHLTIEPEDNEARLRLGDLLERHLEDPAGAERLYLEVRRRTPSPRHEFVAANALIELYRRLGRRDRLVVELARFADRYRGTSPAQSAARLLKELKSESQLEAGRGRTADG